MRSNYKILNSDYPYYITSTIVDWLNIFTEEKYFKILFENFIFYQEQFKIDFIAYVIMSNHFHAIFKCRELEKAIKSIKSYTARLILQELATDKKSSILEDLRKKKLNHKTESKHPVWQEGYHPQEITNNLILKQKAEYIHYNPVRKGLVSNPEDWKYSSASFYLKGEESKLAITSYY